MFKPDLSINAKALVGYVEHRGYRAEPVSLDADPSVVCGYALIGPRGNRGFVARQADGSFPLFPARLWCDGVDCANEHVAARRRIRALHGR